MHNDNDMEEWKHANPGKGKLRIAMILWAIAKERSGKHEGNRDSGQWQSQSHGVSAFWAMVPLRAAWLRIALLVEIYNAQKNIIIFLY
ncbi:hypothetical protein NIES4073_66330 [Kalymmatonema gypsitolerans NIES-4073]|nr:hypothetical protein NIES4073_66330 [Scytonema sp. NIES-4073]